MTTPSLIEAVTPLYVLNAAFTAVCKTASGIITGGGVTVVLLVRDLMFSTFSITSSAAIRAASSLNSPFKVELRHLLHLR